MSKEPKNECCKNCSSRKEGLSITCESCPCHQVKEGKEEYEIVMPEPMLIGANWCVECWPKKVFAQFILKGNSICEEHYLSKENKHERNKI